LALFGRRLAVSFPDTVLEDKESQRDKTTKLGLIARACAIYGVDVIEVFRDRAARGEGQVIRRVLEYLETPQYLRKRLYPLDDALRYAGMLPPLRIPSHRPKIPWNRLAIGEMREGVVNKDGTVDIGLELAPRLKEEVPTGSRVTVKVSSLRPPSAELVDRGQIREYWGYSVETRSMDEVLTDSRFDLKVATSRLGAPLTASLGRLDASLRRASSVKLIFGSPSRGLYEIVGSGLDDRVEFVVNLIPEQCVETVRTEEAIFAGLGLLSLLSLQKA
jgi:predicted SPOUT superfamily RNA methylase MTH1